MLVSWQDDRDRFYELSLDLLAVSGLDGYFRRVNPSWTRVLGWSQQELLARPVLDFVHPDDREATAAARARLGAGEPLLGLINRCQRKDGSYCWLEWRSVSAPEHGLVYAAARDITDRRRAEEQQEGATRQLIFTDRMASVGTLAAGMAHEINNPLAYLIATKPVGVGTGLGLFICHKIIDGLGGAISVRSEPGQGATFRVELPAAASQTPLEHRPAVARASLLVVDHDTAGCVGLAQALPEHDFFIVSGARAARRLLAEGARFDVLFLDVSTSEAAGLESCMRRSRRANPRSPRGRCSSPTERCGPRWRSGWVG